MAQETACAEVRQWLVTYTGSNWRGIMLAPDAKSALAKVRANNPNHEPKRFRVVGEAT